MTVRTLRGRSLAALAGAALAFAAPAFGADAPKGGNTLSLGGKAPAAGPLLTRDQLRGCLSQQAALRTQGSDAQRDQSELDASRQEIARLEGELQSERGTVDATSEDAVAAFNAKLEQLKAKTEAFNAKLPEVNGRIDEYNAAQAKWQNDCGNRRYDEADYFAIQRGK
jgi:septal ring factor EnvC (AmiA/AmiB activator)